MPKNHSKIYKQKFAMATAVGIFILAVFWFLPALSIQFGGGLNRDGLVVKVLRIESAAAQAPGVGAYNYSEEIEAAKNNPSGKGTVVGGKDSSSGISNFIAKMIGALANFFIWLEGGIIYFETEILMALMSYNGFVVSPAVNIGWTLVRDISNLFFVLILLAISIGTILHIESYNFKRLLPKVILMAVLINFSRLICGLIIDFAQVIMMTFAAAFAATAGGGHLYEVLQIEKIINGAKPVTESVATATGATVTVNEKEIGLLEVAASAVLAVVLLLIAIIVILVILVVIMMRIVMLWLLVVLSPIAYIAAAFPSGNKYAQQWWQEFSKYVIIGPVLAFFLWLTFAIATGTQGTDNTAQLGLGKDKKVGQGAENTKTGNPAFFTAVGEDSSVMLQFIIAIGMLMGGLMITQQMGVAGSGFAGNMYSKIRGAGIGAVTKPLGWGKSLGKTAVGWGAKRADDFQAKHIQAPILAALGKTKAGKYMGLDIAGRAGGVKLRTIPGAWKAYREEREKDALGESQAAARDVLHRMTPWDREQTEEADIEREKKVQDATKQYAGADEAEIVVGRVLTHLNKDGTAKDGHEYDVQAGIEVLAKNHDINELIKDPRIGALFKDKWKSADGKKMGEGEKLAVHQGNIKEMLKGMFGENEGARVAVKLGVLGMANNDVWLKGIGGRQEDGTYKFNDAETAARLAAVYALKRDPRGMAQKMRSQDFLTETLDENGMSTHGPVHQAGHFILGATAGGIMKQISHMQPENKIRLQDNLDQLVAWHDSPEAKKIYSADQKRDIESLLIALANDKFGEKNLKMEDVRVKVLGKDYDGARNTRAVIAHNNTNSKDMLGGEKLNIEGKEINLKSLAFKGQQEAYYKAAGGVLRAGGDTNTARSAGVEAVKKYMKPTEQETQTQAAAPKPTPTPAVAEKTPEEHWDSLDGEKRSEYFGKTMKERQDRGEAVDLKEEVIKEAQQTAYSDQYGREAKAADKQIDAGYKKMKPGELISQAPVDFEKISKALTTAMKQGLNSQGIIQSMDGLETVLNYVRDAIKSLPDGKGKEDAEKGMDLLSADFSDVYGRAKGGLLNPTSADILLKKISGTLEDISQKTVPPKPKA